MSEQQTQLTSESILIADCGSTTTKVVLLDAVGGQYRVIAYGESSSTVGDNWDDISVGVVHAIRRLEEITGQTFLDGDGQLITPETRDGKGIDLFLAVSSAAKPLRVVLTGLARSVSLSSARRAALTTYSQIVDEIAIEEDVERDQSRTDDAKINAIWHAAPDVICVVGGTDGGATEPVLDIVRNVVRVSLYLIGQDVPIVIFAGNAQLRETVTQLIGEIAPLHVVDNVRPLPEVENIGPAAEEIELCFYERQLKYLPGGEVLGRWGASPILPAARTADYTIRYCDRAWDPSRSALGVNVGSASVTLNVCEKGRPMTLVRSDMGVGYGLPELLEQIDIRDILRWLPFELDAGQARDRLMNKALKPCSIPQTREDLLLEQAAAREAVRLALRDLLPGWLGRSDGRPHEMAIPPCAPIIASGGILAHVPYHGHAALMLLDALQPIGVNELYLDEYNLLSSLGAVANARPLAMVQTLRNGGLTFLGTAIVPTGRARPGDRVMIIRPAGGEPHLVSEVMYGNLMAIPFASLEPGTILELIPDRGVDVGRGPGKGMTLAYKGGTVGLIVDARGRPLEFEDDPQVQRQRIYGWLTEMMNA
jgi:hypothetical protein